MRRIYEKKKGQEAFDIFLFIAIAVAIFVFAPIGFKLFNSIVPPLTNTIASSNISGASNVNATGTSITNTFTNFWDSAIAVAFFVNILVILIASFMIDIHPAFAVFYIVTVVLALIFAPAYFSGVSKLYGTAPDSPFQAEATHLPISAFIVNNFGAILLGVLILSGIIMFAKFKFGGGR